MFSPLEEIKSRLDLAELIQSYVRLHKAGINYKANCPFHHEKTPSFFVSPSRQIWHCFGCGKGGDVFKFVMEIEGHDFPEAMRLLATRAGVVLKREDPVIRSERNLIYDICEEATKIFIETLSQTSAAKTYLKSRGITEDTEREFRVGFAPQSWDYLLNALRGKGFRVEDIEKAGLAIKSQEKNSWYDRFRSRIMFPVTDGNGRVVGFSGRIFGDGHKKEEAKYINTPQTLVYDKSRVLYGFDKAKQEIRSKNQVVIVEGQMDCLMSWQAGVKNVIAVSGTALAPQQLKTIKRLCDRVVSSFDTDAAGESATRRSLALASQFEFECRVATIPSGKDPADTIFENPQNWIEAVASAKPVVEFYFEKAMREKDPASVGGKKDIAASVLPWVVALSNEIEKAHWIKTLAINLSVGEEVISKELNKTSSNALEYQNRPNDNFSGQTQKVSARRELLEERLLALMPLVGEEVRVRELQDHHIEFKCAINNDLFQAFSGGIKVVSLELDRELELLRFKGEVLQASLDNISEEFVLCKRELEKECIKERLLALGEEITKLERMGQGSAVLPLLHNFRELSGKLKEFS